MSESPIPLVPCARCGYPAPGATCPTCGQVADGSAPAAPSGAPASLRERSLSGPLAGPLAGASQGAVALFHGLWTLATTKKIGRWLVPPLVISCALIGLFLSWIFRELDALARSARDARIELEFEWLGREGERGWLKGLLDSVCAALEWGLNAAVELLVSSPVRWLGWFLLGSLVVWYGLSIVYEALAGPFLDEVHARVEARWFGADPRERLQPGGGRMARARAWLAHEVGAAWASLQAALVTALLLLFALPLYFVPVAGYWLFAIVSGFATSVGLLDIAFERRGWPLRFRLRFVGRHLPALVVFGIVAGLLLSIPILGALLFVPASSLGGLWLLCRLDKGFLRRPRRTAGDR